MNKLIAFIVLIIQFSCLQAPQDSLTFKIRYQPGKIYNHSADRTLNSLIKYSGSEQSLLKLKSMGIQNPTFSNRKSHTEWVLKTGELMDETNFPASVEYAVTVSTDGETAAPVMASFYGKFLNDNLPVFDSIVSLGLFEEEKQTLLQSLQSTFTQLSFPERRVKIGEQFSIDSQTSIPMEGSTLDMEVTTTYQLTRIEKGLAHFDISQKYVLLPQLLDNSLKGTVSGKGQLVYDIANTIVLNYTLDTEMEIRKKLDSFEFELKASSGIIQTTSLATEKAASL